MKHANGKMAIVFIRGMWLAFLFGATAFHYEYKSPVRIENWNPKPAR